MVKEKTLLTGRKYNFKHIEIKVLEKDEKGNVMVFCAYYQRNGVGGRASESLIEVNELWDQRPGSKRPKGYIAAGAIEKDRGESVSVLVSEEWYKEHVADKTIDAIKKKWQETL